MQRDGYWGLRKVTIRISGSAWPSTCPERFHLHGCFARQPCHPILPAAPRPTLGHIPSSFIQKRPSIFSLVPPPVIVSFGGEATEVWGHGDNPTALINGIFTGQHTWVPPLALFSV